jgi:hypothetical protein
MLSVLHRLAAAAVLALAPLTSSVPAQAGAVDTASGAQRSPVSAAAAVECPDGYVCIYPEIDFGGQPWVKRAVDGSVKDLPSAIRDRGSSIRDNSTRTARVYENATTRGAGCA